MLIAIEGIDGAGKSTQAELLEKSLRDDGHKVCSTRWNSSPIVKPATKHVKKSRAVTARTLSLLEAADFSDRYDQIDSDLKEGAFVCADRWIYTAYARGIARWLPRGWLRDLYSYAQAPAVCFYLRIPVDLALERILKVRHLKHYEAGMDLEISHDMRESFRVFQSRAVAEYEELATAHGFTPIDATAPVEEQHLQIRRTVEQLRESRSAHV